MKINHANLFINFMFFYIFLQNFRKPWSQKIRLKFVFTYYVE